MAPHADEARGFPNGRENVQGNGSSSTSHGNGQRNMPDPGDYIQFECLPPGGPLNRWSHAMTREHDFPGAQVSRPPEARPHFFFFFFPGSCSFCCLKVMVG